MKKIFIAISSLLLISWIILLNISQNKAQNILNDLGGKYSSEREKGGLRLINNKWKFKEENWDTWTASRVTHVDGDSLIKASNSLLDFKHKWSLIMQMKHITLAFNYQQDEQKANDFLHEKELQFQTYIFFWNNFLDTETDYYKKSISSHEYFILKKEHYYNGYNYSTQKYDTSFTKYDFWKVDDRVLVCGGAIGFPELKTKGDSIRVIREYYNGNISALQSDSILNSWNE